jgi:tetratricopeptide (TPR) repeat protein
MAKPCNGLHSPPTKEEAIVRSNKVSNSANFSLARLKQSSVDHSKYGGNWDWAFALLLAAVTLLAYQPAWNGKPIMDDVRHLTTPESRPLAGLGQLWIHPNTTQQYHPLVDTLFWVEDKLWGQSMLGHHIVNILLHVIAALLLWKILDQLGMRGAKLASAIFALHPVQVESVAFLVELKNTLSGVLFFLCVLAYLRFDRKRNWQAYTLVLLLFVPGLLAKTVVALLPLTMLLVLWWQNGRVRWRRDVIPLIPFVILGAAAGACTGWMEREFSGAKGEGFAFSAVERGLIAGRAFMFYLGKLFWPTDLMLIYPRWEISAAVWWQYLFPAAACALLISAWMLRRRLPGLLLGLLFFTMMMIPIIGFFNVRLFRFQFVADHFQYLGMIGVVAPVAAGAVTLVERWKDWRRTAGYAACLGLLFVLAALTWRQSEMFRDSETCYRTVIERNPNAWAAQINYGEILLRDGRLDEAIFHFEKVLQLNPQDSGALKGAHLNYGSALLAKGLVDEAILQFGRALEIQPDYRVENSLGSAFHRKGQSPEAIAHYEKALEIEPSAVAAQNNLAWILATCSDGSLRDGGRALKLARRATELSGGTDPLILHTLAAAYAETGQFSEAVKTARRALQFATDHRRNDLVGQLRIEIGLYESGFPYRENGD